ncbi:MAG: DUF417 family protein [Pyrinomonadaceae bacterium]|nr:DUF417 family protein [Pyrinomonadaceae bacterium]
MTTNRFKIGYVLGVAGVAITLLWIGLFEFTPTEAAAIKPLVSNHFGMRWLYRILSEQGVSNLIGATEIIGAFALLLSLKFNQLGRYSGIGSAVIFATTLSFLVTTPGIWKSVDGFPITDFFLLKDIPFLAISLMVWARGSEKTGRQPD